MSKLTFNKSSKTSKTDTVNEKKTPSDNIVWPEWVDSEVTAEKWETFSKPHKTGKDTKTSVVSKYEESTFEDPYVTKLPEIIQRNCNTWAKLSALYQDVRPVIYADPDYPDLVSLNRHLLCSEFYRSFISSIYNLMYLGITHPFPVQWQTATYRANTSSQPWKPWHHIYSMCKAGEGQHNPQVNSSGKYIVRLFWMGCWRKITVDSLIPIDISLNILIPITKNKNKEVIELWPILLSKALLKLAVLTSTPIEELVEFDIIQCLTGWVLQKINTRDMQMIEKWEIITGYTDHYVWTDKNPLEKKGKRSKEEKKKEPKKKSNKLPTTFSSFHLIAACKDLMEVPEEIPDISPCPSHEFLIDVTRDIPLLQYPDPSTILPRWKEFRWIDWAVQKGIANPIEKPHNIKYCKLVSNLRKISDFDKTSSEEAERIKENIEKTSPTKGRKKDKNSEKSSKKDSKKKKGSETSSKSKKGKKGVVETPDPSFWTHFYNVSDHIEYLKVYLLPSQMESCTVISDLEIDKGDKKGKDTKKESNVQRLRWLNGLKISHNEPFYLFMDSIDYKYIVFNLSHVGNKMPKPNFKYEIKEIKQNLCEKEICHIEPCPSECKCMEKIEFVPEITDYNDTRTTGCFNVEEYNWKENKIGKMIYYLNTCGSKSLTLLIEPGRTVWKLWLHSCTHLVLTVLSQTKVVIGTIEDILGCMKLESELVLGQIYDICTAFGNVVSHFGTPEFRQHLRNYYKVYVPDGKFTKTELALMHRCFMRMFIKKLDDLTYTVKDKIIFTNALRTLFIDPTITLDIESNRVSVDAEDEIDEFCKCEDLNKEKMRQRAAVKIQSFFKMIYVRKLIAKHNVLHPQFLTTFEHLKNIYNTMYAPNVRINNAAVIIRNYIFNKRMIDLKQYFPYINDLTNVISVDKMEGSFSQIEKPWIVFTRFQFHVEYSMLIKFCMSSDLPEYVLRVFDDDMNEEIKKYTNVPVVTHYKNNMTYTVIAYGWTRDMPVKSNRWSVTIIRQQLYIPNDITIDKDETHVKTIKGEYVPNLNNRIFRYIITSDTPELLSFRLSLSSKNVDVTLSCLTDGNVTTNTITGVSSVILPYVSLMIGNYRDSNISKVDSASYLFRNSLSRGKSLRKRKLLSPKSSKKSKIMDSIQVSANTSTSYDTRSMQTDNSDKSYDSNKFNSYYVLEAYVNNDSWPLTQEEWDRVEERRQKDYLEKELENQKVPRLSTSNKSLKNQNILTPYYEIQYVKNKKSTLKIEMDREKIDYIKNFKMKCFNFDLENLKKAKQIRQNFIDSFKPVSFISGMEGNVEEELSSIKLNYEPSSLIEEESIARICPECNKFVPMEEPKFIANPNSELRYLPEFTLNKVYEFDYFRKVLTEDDVEEYTNVLIERNVVFGEKYYNSKTKIEELNESLRETISKLSTHYEEIEDASNEIYEELEEKRSALITRLLENEAENNPKDKKGKKGKKDKKKK